MPAGRWSRLASGHEEITVHHQRLVNKKLLEVLSNYLEDAKGMREKVEKCKDGLAEHRDTLARRWTQIEELLDKAMERIKASL